MRVLDSIPENGGEGSAVTVGVFDGHHLGHRKLLETTVARARERGIHSAVLTFREHPDLLLRGEAPPRLQTEEERMRGFEEAGIDLVLRLAFTPEFRDMEAPEFARRLLVGGLQCRALVLGFDSAICKGRSGTVDAFRRLGSELGFTAERADAVLVDGDPVSSSRIREALRAGAVGRAALLLGRPFTFEGIVGEGARRGRTLGFPTANLSLPDLALPKPGVYAVTASPGTGGEKEERLPGVCNLGPRPTFEEERGGLAEVHLLDFDGDLYGKRLRIAFHARIRGIHAFPDTEALAARIRRDLDEARRLLADGPPPA